MKSTTLKAISLVSLAAAGATMLASCAAITEGLADAHAVTYRVALEGPSTAALENFEYWGKPQRSAPAETVKSSLQGAGDPQNAAVGGVWSVETIVNAKETARLSATPPKGTVATCLIVVDGGTEIARETGAPGAAVTCQAVTPAFSRK
ncbi:hypothetical protein [Klugiella xanthotipulae]|nr:hypothetical protein [Klugiella xanthotipulae]